MNVKDGFARMKANKGKALHYFFCEADEKGKPVLILDSKPIPSKETAPILAKAKKKSKSTGEMEMNPEGELLVTPRGAPPTSLARGVQIVARENSVMPKAIKVQKEKPEEESPKEERKPNAAQSTSEKTGEDTTKAPKSPDLANPPPPPDLTAKPASAGGAVAKGQAEAIKAKTAKRWPDPLRQDPAMAKLLDTRNALKNMLDERLDRGDTVDQVKPVMAKLVEVDKKLEAAQKRLNASGVSPKQVGAEYKGEDEKFGWRAKGAVFSEVVAGTPKDIEKPIQKKGESDEDYAKRQKKYREKVDAWRQQNWDKKSDLGNVVTKYFTEEERQQHALNVGEDGLVRDSSGKVYSGDREYVMSTEGELHQFKPHEDSDRIRTSDEDNQANQAVLDKMFSDQATILKAHQAKAQKDLEEVNKILNDTTITDQAVIQEAQKEKDRIETVLRTQMFATANAKNIIPTKMRNAHHSSVLRGKEAAGAGDIDIEAGKIRSISNNSGHYKPKAAQMIQTVELLLRQGALLDKNYVMPDPQTGKAVPLSGKVLQLHQSTTQLEAKIQNGLRQAEMVTRDLKTKEEQGEETEAEQKQLEKYYDQIGKVLTQIEQAKKMLAKLGAGPANKFTDAKVSFKDVKENMSGLQIRTGVTSKTSTVEEFLTTGAGNTKQADAKKSMMDELKAKTADKKAVLDRMAETRGKRVAQQMQQLPAQLAEGKNRLTEIEQRLAELGTKASAAKERAKLVQQQHWLTQWLAKGQAYLKAEKPPTEKDLQRFIDIFHGRKPEPEETGEEPGRAANAVAEEGAADVRHDGTEEAPSSHQYARSLRDDADVDTTVSEPHAEEAPAEHRYARTAGTDREEDDAELDSNIADDEDDEFDSDIEDDDDDDREADSDDEDDDNKR